MPSAEKNVDSSSLSTVKKLWPYMWPADRNDLKLRVILAIAALMAAKVFSTVVPFAYKGLIDALGNPTDSQQMLYLSLSLPVIFAIAYGVGQIFEAGFMQLRDILFASVGQHAVRGLARRTFKHLHNLSLRYHLQRRIGGLSRVMVAALSVPVISFNPSIKSASTVA